MTESNADIYRAAIDRFNQGDLDGYLDVYSDDVVFGGVSQAPMGVPATGKDAYFTITTILTMHDGKCVERWSTADMLGLVIQLGAVPAPAEGRFA